MSENFVPPQPNIAGQVSPEEATVLANQNPEDPEAAAVLARLDAGGNGPAYALVVDTDEQGNRTPSHYVGLDPRDMGTRVRDIEAHGLPMPAVTHAEPQAENPPAKSEASSGGFLESLVADPNGLFAQGVLERAVADPRALLEGVAEPSDADFQSAEQLCGIAQHMIINPEAAATVSAEQLQRLKQQGQEEVAHVEGVLDKIGQSLDTPGSNFGEVVELVPKVQAATVWLRDALQPGQPLDENQLYNAVVLLRTFANDYANAHRHNGRRHDELEDHTRTFRNGVDTVADDMRHTADNAEVATEEARLGGGGVSIDRSLQAVRTRGQADIAGHIEACERDTTQSLNTARGITTDYDSLLEAADELSHNVRVSRPGNLPYPNSVNDAVEEVARAVGIVQMGNPMYMHMAVEMLDQLERQVALVNAATENTATDEANLIRPAMQKIRDKLAALRQKLE